MLNKKFIKSSLGLLSFSIILSSSLSTNLNAANVKLKSNLTTIYYGAYSTDKQGILLIDDKIKISLGSITVSRETNNFTDFNDLVTKSSLGEDGLKRQVLGVIEIDRSSQKQASIRQVVQKRHAPEKQARRGVSL